MKNTYFVLGAFLFSISVFGSNERLLSKNIRKIDFHNVIVTAYCIQAASFGGLNIANYATKCLGADSCTARVFSCINAKEVGNNGVQKSAFSLVFIP